MVIQIHSLKEAIYNISRLYTTPSPRDQMLGLLVLVVLAVLIHPTLLIYQILAVSISFLFLRN